MNGNYCIDIDGKKCLLPGVSQNLEYLDNQLLSVLEKIQKERVDSMTKYQRLMEELESVGIGKMKCFGNSMMPIIKSGSALTFKKQDDYEVGDIVFCKVRGRFIDAHKITKKTLNHGFMISNNHGFDNGFTKTIYGKVVKIERD